MATFYDEWCSVFWVFSFVAQSFARTQTYTLEGCNTSRSIHSIDGAVVQSQKGTFYTTNSINCSVIFQTLSPHTTFLVQILSLDIRNDGIICTDHLSLTELHNLTSASSVILDRFCGTSDSPQLPKVIYTRGGYLMIKWVATTGSKDHLGFSFSLTEISRDPVYCSTKGRFHCDKVTCISESLVCDGTSNCPQGQDEVDCDRSLPANDLQVASPNGLDGSSMFSSTTTASSTTVRLPAGATTERAPTNEVYLWLPLIVVVIFTGIMVTLIMVGRRGEDNTYDQTSDEASVPEDDGRLRRKTERTERDSIAGNAVGSGTFVAQNFIGLTGRNIGGEMRQGMALDEVPALQQDMTTRAHVVLPVYTKADLFLVTLALLAMLVMFACCAWIGCCMRAAEDVNNSAEVNLVDEHNRLQLEMNANAGYEHSEGMPETPPPTYDVIARQTSYVSHISQTSDQISIPPEYDEAVDWPNDQSRSRHSRLRHITRSRSTGRPASSGSRGPNFARLFSRSISATTGATGSESDTTPNTTSSTSGNNTTELSSVFLDTSPEIVIHNAALPRPASHPLMSTPQSAHQGVPPGPSEVVIDDDVFHHQDDPGATEPTQPSFFL